MAINLSGTTFGYLLIAIGLIAAAGIVLGVRMRAAGLKLKHLAMPVIAIGVGVTFAFGLTGRPEQACTPKPGETSCTPGETGVKEVKIPRPPARP